MCPVYPRKTTKNPQVHMVQDDNAGRSTGKSLERSWPHTPWWPTHLFPSLPQQEELQNKITSVNWEFQEVSYLEKEKMTKNSFFLHLSFQTILLNYHCSLSYHVLGEIRVSSPPPSWERETLEWAFNPIFSEPSWLWLLSLAMLIVLPFNLCNI